MTSVIIIAAMTCLCLIVSILCNFHIKIKQHIIPIYWVIPLVASIVLVLTHLLSFEDVWHGLTADVAVNPIKIVILFISMTILSIFLDEVGFFALLASMTLKKAKGNQLRMFIYLYIIVSLLTMVTSNDIVILTFTPFICYFAKNAKISPLPYLFGEFIAANTFSMMLIIGNPTNIYLAGSMDITFIDYLKVMWLPTLFAGTVAFFVLFRLFRKQLRDPIKQEEGQKIIYQKPLMIIGLIHLGLCLLFLIISYYIQMEMWLITFIFTTSLFICTLIYQWSRKKSARALVVCLKRAPWEVIPFVTAMFIVVFALDKYMVTQELARLLDGGNWTILTYGLSSSFVANCINNIPMSELFAPIVKFATLTKPALYASIIGSNIGAYMTPMGALAGMMWMNILKKNQIPFRFITFVKYGVLIALPTLLVALGGLYLAFMIL